jgi:hypothetical protein
MASTFVTVWICSLISMSIMGSRLFLGRCYKKKFGLGDALTVAALFCSFPHLAVVHVVILWNTNNISPPWGNILELSNKEIRQREIGSKLVLFVRCLYISM